MPSRRTHLKRRHGCLVCKTRKVKCDLQRPECGHCSKRGEYCVYNNDDCSSAQFVMYTDNRKARTYDYDTAFRSSNVLITPSPSPPSPYLHTPQIPYYSPLPRHVFNTDLSLLEHFTSQVSFTLTDREDVQNLYASLVVDMSFEHGFLSHSILATAAVHKINTENMTEDQLSHCQYLSLYHQNAAMALIRPQVADLSAENCEALYISACFIFILNLASAPLAIPSMLIDRFVELCELARGVAAVIRQSSPLIKTGRLKAFFKLVKWDNLISGPGQPTRTPLVAELQKLVDSLPSEMDHLKDIYQGALRCLNITLAAVIVNRAHPAIIFMWFVILDRQYITLVAARDRIALRILECYGECAGCLPERWWSRRWGRDLVSGVRCVLQNQNKTDMSSFQSQGVEAYVAG